jgi:HSP20 family protein
MKEDLGSFMELARIQSEINRLFDNLLELRSGGGGAVTANWVPNGDVLAGRDKLILRFELPGVNPKDIRVAVASGDLILSGTKPEQPVAPSARQHASDRGQGPFRRVIHLGITTNPHQARAVLKDGLLTVELPRVANRRGEEVPIPVNEEASVDA